MFLTGIFTACFVLLFRLWKKPLNRRLWLVFVFFALIVSFILSVVSVWSVWNPSITNWDFYGGEFNGSLPWSKLSYPFHMSVYHTPFVRLLYDGINIRGEVAFNIFLTTAKVGQINGTFTYPPIFGRTSLSYSINFPFFNSGAAFFAFLTIFFFFFNMIGALLALALLFALEKRKRLSA